MVDGLSSLVAQPTSPQAPEGQGSASGTDAASLSALLQQRGGDGQGAPGGAPAPNYEQTMAALHHLSVFQRHWKEILDDPDIGKKSIRPEVLDMMADVMGEGLVTLPQVMSQLAAFPPDPLAQRQWVQKHYDNGQKAIQGVLVHHAAAFPRNGGPSDPPLPPAGAQGDVMSGLMSHYKKGK